EPLRRPLSGVLARPHAGSHMKAGRRNGTETMDQARIIEILSPADGAEDARRERSVRARFWATARRAARHVPFMDEVVAAYYCALDQRTPARVRATLLAALAYFVLPFDVVPDF